MCIMRNVLKTVLLAPDLCVCNNDGRLKLFFKVAYLINAI